MAAATPKLLTVETFIELLETTRQRFTDEYCPLDTSQELALAKANDLVRTDVATVKRDTVKRVAISTLRDLKNHVGNEVYVLCALAVNPTQLGSSKLKWFLPKVREWWSRSECPRGLSKVVENYLTFGASKKHFQVNEPEQPPSKKRRVGENVGKELQIDHLEAIHSDCNDELAQQGKNSPNEEESGTTPNPAQNVSCSSPEARRYSPTSESTNTNLKPLNDRLEPSQVEEKANKFDGNAFIVNIDDAQYALSFKEHVGEIWLTNRKYNRDEIDEKNMTFLDEKRRSFITLWISEALGERLGKRGKQMVDWKGEEEGQPINNGNLDPCPRKELT